MSAFYSPTAFFLKAIHNGNETVCFENNNVYCYCGILAGQTPSLA